jgi:transcriptional regulator with XRE-family HTH domain
MEVNRHALRALRERSGLSLSQLARAAEVSQPHLSNVEAGRRRPSAALTVRLAQELRVPVVALLASPRPGGDRLDPDP